MRVLFLHPNFPAQFGYLAMELAKDSRNQVVFVTKRQEGQLKNVRKVLYAPSRPVSSQTHHYVKNLESAVLEGQAVYRIVQKLKTEGFVPDVVYGHSGWGPTLFLRDILPKTRLLCYFEWFYNARGSDADFDPADPLTEDDFPRIRSKNAPILMDLSSCDHGRSPTHWQHQQFPSEYHSRITVLHDGVDTEFFRPFPGISRKIPSIQRDLSDVKEIVTYVARGMEPYRGFPQFMEAVALLQRRRPECHVIIVGQDRVAYGKSLPNGKTYKQDALERLELDQSRIHFTGLLPLDQYRQILRMSSVHAYLTRPFVLSWSFMEAMACGCVMVASNTEPVREVLIEGHNGLLVDFFYTRALTNRIEEALEHPGRQRLGANARSTIVDHYSLKKLLPRHIDLLSG
ncbi:MAG: glycosyltransferase family 4 protein [SAR324 cluster bacterium]|nr:glycosyltransferase family 4 protein [SAR324 cluster bacterium]